MASLRAPTMLAALALLSLPHRVSAQAEPAAKQQAVEQAIHTAHASMRQAAGRLDANALYAFVLDSPTPPIIEDGRVEPTRGSALANTTAGFQALTGISYHYTREHVSVLSPTTALWIGEGTATAGLQDGREIVAPFAETVVFVLRDGQWKVLHAHRSAPNPR